MALAHVLYRCDSPSRPRSRSTSASCI